MRPNMSGKVACRVAPVTSTLFITNPHGRIMLSLPQSRDAQIEWLHSLAELPEDELNLWASTTNGTDFISFVQLHLPSTGVPEFARPHEVVSSVRSLRENERAWNHALMRVPLEADDLCKQQSLPEAETLLLKFAGTCPWQLFKEVAENQASHYQTPS